MKSNNDVPDMPIIFEELMALPPLGINPDAIAFSTVSMESDKQICVHEKASPNAKGGTVITVDVDASSVKGRFPTSADSVILNPKFPFIALKANLSLQVYNMDLKGRVAQCETGSDVVFWRWVNSTTIAYATAVAVFHWKVLSKNGVINKGQEPKRFFLRHEQLSGAQIINYRVTNVHTSSSPKSWGCLVGIAKEGNRIVGRMQLFSAEKQLTQIIEGHACAFAHWGENNKRRLFCVASRTNNHSRLYISEVGDQSIPVSDQPYIKRKGDIYFPPEAVDDFPVTMQVSNRYKVVYLITKFGYLHIFDLASAQLIYMNRISADTVFVTVPSSEGGIVGINKQGQVLSVQLDKDTVVDYIHSKLGNPNLAIEFATRNGLPMKFLPKQLNQLIAQGQYTAAAELVFKSPQQLLRTAEHLQKFLAAPSFSGQPSAAMQYFNVAMNLGKLNKYESTELARAVLKQGRIDLFEKWLKDDKFECSEELGDLAVAVDPRFGGSIYYRAQVHGKLIKCFLDTGEAHKIVAYADKVGYRPDYASILALLLKTNPPQAAYITQALLEKQPPVVPIEAIIGMYVQEQRMPEMVNLFQETLKQNKSEHGLAQTRFLEFLLTGGSPHVAERIMASGIFCQYSMSYIANLCDKVGLYERATFLRSQRK